VLQQQATYAGSIIPLVDSDIPNKLYVDTELAAKSELTNLTSVVNVGASSVDITANGVLGLSVGDSTITAAHKFVYAGGVTISADTDVPNKAYVDAAVGAISTTAIIAGNSNVTV